MLLKLVFKSIVLPVEDGLYGRNAPSDMCVIFSEPEEWNLKKRNMTLRSCANRECRIPVKKIDLNRHMC